MVHVRCNPSSPKFEPPWLGRNGCGMTIYVVGMLKRSCGFGKHQKLQGDVGDMFSKSVCVYFFIYTYIYTYYIYTVTYIFIFTYIYIFIQIYIYIYIYNHLSRLKTLLFIIRDMFVFLHMSSMWFQILLCALFIDRLTCSHTFCPAPGLQKQHEMGNITNFQPNLFIATCSE